MKRIRVWLSAVLTVCLLLPALAAPSVAQTAGDADFDGGGTVDFADFVQFVAAFGGSAGKFDLDDNGAVDFADFVKFVSLFGQSAEPNRPPVADAGPDAGAETTSTIVLDGSGSADPDGDALTYTWTQVYGETVSLSSSTAAQPWFNTQTAGNYAFELTVTDGEAASDADTVIVNVVKLAEAAVLVGAPDAPIAYQSANGDAITFSLSSGATVSAGDVLVNTQEPYFLKRVVSVTSQSGQQATVQTEDAALTDVIEEASVTATFRVGQPGSAKLAIPGLRKAQADGNGNGGLSSDFTNVSVHSSASASLTASGDVRFDPEYEFTLEIGLFKLKEFRLAAQGDLVATLSLTLAAQAAFSLEADKTIASVPAIPYHVIIPAGVPIDLAIQAEFGVGAEIYANAAGSVTAGLQLTKPVQLGSEYVDGEWQSLNSTEPVTWEVLGPDLALYGAAGIQGYLRGQINVKLYDVAGPYIGLKPYLGFDATADLATKQLTWSVNAGVDAYVGAQVEILGRELADQRWDFNLAEADLTSGVFGLPTYSISGLVTEDGAALPTVTVALTGDEAAQASTGSDGTYRFEDLLNGTYTVTPSKSGYTFTPSDLLVELAGDDASGKDFAATAESQPPGGTGDSVTVALPVGSANMAFVYIPAGTFTMGSPSSESGRSSDEGPQHEVTISQGFYLGKYEVTQGQWEAVMGTTPWSGQSYVQENANNPAVYVSWNDAQDFVQRLNAAAGDSVYRLPTEAEWEYACRAGTSTRWSFGESESELANYAWYRDNAWNVGEQYAHQVGTKLSNPWGLHDMHGNVWEWCQDWYSSSYYGSSPATDPPGTSSGSSRVLRGGGFSNYALSTRSAYREYNSPGYRINYIGFRLLRRAQ